MRDQKLPMLLSCVVTLKCNEVSVSKTKVTRQFLELDYLEKGSIFRTVYLVIAPD